MPINDIPPVGIPDRENLPGTEQSENSSGTTAAPPAEPDPTRAEPFRITNVRVNATTLSGGGPTPGTISGSIEIHQG